MKKSYLIACIMLLATSMAAKAELDVNKGLMCASMLTHDCDGAGGCYPGTASDIGVPRFFRLDIPSKSIVIDIQGQGKVTSQINQVYNEADRIALQGYEDSHAWSMEVLLASGDMTLVATSGQVGYVIHGACTEIE